MSTTYFALTIGPIYKTLAMAKKTREIWAASYLFSYLMQQIVRSLKNTGELVIPSANEPEKSMAGLFPDRLILKVEQEENSYQKRKNLVLKARDQFLMKIAGKDFENQKQFFSEYFQILFLEVKLAQKEDPIMTINPMLDSMELKCAYVTSYTVNYLKIFFNRLPDTFLFHEEIYETGFRFPSLFKISAAELKNHEPSKIPDEFNDTNKKDFFEKLTNAFVNEKDEDQKVRRLLKIAYDNYPQNKEELKNWQRNSDAEIFRFCHNYIAIVQADGDNLNYVLHALYQMGGAPALQCFSELLMDFGYEAGKEISRFGGIPIYLGGDDLLFFAPVRMKERTVFHLVRDIDTLFEKKIQNSDTISQLLGEWNSSITKVNRRKRVNLSFSYGISISYYKYPMKEALETARNLLFNNSKLVPEKNAISFQVLKHKGQLFGATWQKGWESFIPFLFDFLKQFYSKPEKERKMVFLSSVQNKLSPLRPAIYHILVGWKVDPAKPGFKKVINKDADVKPGKEEYFKKLIDNFFNEEEHLISREFLEFSFYYLLKMYHNMEEVYGNNYQTARKAVDTLYATLRFLQFITQPDKNLNDEEE